LSSETDSVNRQDIEHFADDYCVGRNLTSLLRLYDSVREELSRQGIRGGGIEAEGGERRPLNISVSGQRVDLSQPYDSIDLKGCVIGPPDYGARYERPALDREDDRVGTEGSHPGALDPSLGSEGLRGGPLEGRVYGVGAGERVLDPSVGGQSLLPKAVEDGIRAQRPDLFAEQDRIRPKGTEYDPGYHGVSVKCGIYACICDRIDGQCVGLRRYKDSVKSGRCCLCGKDHSIREYTALNLGQTDGID